MIILAATLVALLVGTAYYAGTGFWKKPRLAIVTFVSLFVPAVVLLPLSDWKPPLLGWSSGWTYLALVYLAVHLAGLVAWFWALVEERLVRLFHKLKVGLIIFLGIAAVWFVTMYDSEALQIIAGLILIAIIVFGGLWLFRVLHEGPAGREEAGKAGEDRKRASQQAKEDHPPADQPQSEPSESHPEDGKTAADRLKDLMKNVRVRPDLKVRFEDLRPRFSQSMKIENLRSRIPWTISVENINAPAKKLFGRLCRTIRNRSGKSKNPPPPSS